MSLALALTYRAGGPDADRRGGRRAPRRDRRGGGGASWAGGSVPHSVSVFGSAGFTGALTARLLYRHPSLELSALTARSDVGRRLDDLYPHHRVPLELEELDLDRHADVDAAVVAYPHGAAAPLVAALRERGVRVVDLSADFRLHDPAVYGRWYREHEAPELLDEAVYGLPELYREEIRGAVAGREPGLLPDRVAARARAAGARGGDRGRGHRRQVRSVGRGARRDREDPLRHRRREPERVRRPASPPHSRDRAGALDRLRPPRRPDHVHPASRAARPGRARELLRDARRRRRTSSTSSSCTPTPTRMSRSSSWPPRRRACATSARRTSVASRYTGTSEPGA